MTLRFANAAANRVTFKIMGNAAFSFWIASAGVELTPELDDQLDRRSSHGRSARSKPRALPFGERVTGIESTLGPLKSRRQWQLRRCRREGARRQKDRRANRAIIVIVTGILRRRLRRCLRHRGVLHDRGMGVLRQTVQMHVIKGEHDLQRQRDQRQHAAMPLIANNPAHPQRHPAPPREGAC